MLLGSITLHAQPTLPELNSPNQSTFPPARLPAPGGGLHVGEALRRQGVVNYLPRVMLEPAQQLAITSPLCRLRRLPPRRAIRPRSNLCVTAYAAVLNCFCCC